EKEQGAAPVTTGGKEKSTIDPEARRILRLAGDYMKAADKFSVHAEISFDDVLPSGRKIEYSRGGDIIIDRPGRFYANVYDENEHRRIFNNGKILTIHDTNNHTYASIKVPAKIDEAIDYAREHFTVSMPLADIMVADPYKNIMERVNSGIYVGLQYAEGEFLHHLLFSNEAVDVQLWIEDGMYPFIRKLVITYKTLFAAPQYRAVLTEWDFNPATPDILFTFQPPEDATELEFLPVKQSPP
ncbi:MAG: DUF2092 domain-containing protein, partial [Gammaproteobacteria bacterium]